MNFIYPAAKQAMLQAQINWLTDPIYGILLNTNYYTPSPNHATLADIQAHAFIASSAHLTGRTALLGAADADDLPFLNVTGPIIEAMILVKDGGTAIGSPLIAYIDTAANLPYTPDGRAIVIQWDNGPNRIFHL